MPEQIKLINLVPEADRRAFQHYDIDVRSVKGEYKLEGSFFYYFDMKKRAWVGFKDKRIIQIEIKNSYEEKLALIKEHQDKPKIVLFHHGVEIEEETNYIYNMMTPAGGKKPKYLEGFLLSRDEYFSRVAIPSYKYIIIIPNVWLIGEIIYTEALPSE